MVYAVAWQGPVPQLVVGASGMLVLALWWSRRGLGPVRHAGGTATWALAATLVLAWWLAGHGALATEQGPGRPPVLQPLAWPWYVPLGCAVSMALGVLLARPGDATRTETP